MTDESVLRHVSLAREHARLGNYDAALNSYANAKDEAEYQLNAIRDPDELRLWNGIAKDIVIEQATVLKIKNTQNKILDLIDVPFKPPPQQSGDDIELDPPVWSKPAEPRVLRKPEKRPQVKVSKPTSRLPQNQKKQVQRPPSVKKVDASKPVKDVSSDPLAQQIIDMGILIREPDVSWDSIAGLKQVKRLLRQNLVILPMRPDICKGLLAPWKSVLFYGPPGTGKTYLAKAVATECKRTFFNITSATITSRFHGESEKLVSHLFTLAEQMSPSTIFFDEIDSLASQRGAQSENEVSRRMKSQLLTKLEGIDSATDASSVFVIAATNFPWDLDEAVLRRFQKRVYIPLPDVEAREYLLKMNISDLIDEDFDMRMWAEKLDGYSCADITNLCRDAAQMVFNNKCSLMDTQQWLDMPAEEAKVIITNNDFAKVVEKRKSTVDPQTLRKYEEWRQQKGAE